MLVWRSYRDSERAPCPVALRARRREVRASLPEPASVRLDVGPFDRAVGLVSGRAYAPGPIEAAALAREPILLIDGITRRLAKPAEAPLGSSAYHMPFVDGDALVTPFTAQAGPVEPVTIRARPIGPGAFLVDRGMSAIAVEVGGGPFNGVVRYDPYHGCLWLEDDGPIPADADVRVQLRAMGAWRKTFTPGTHHVHTEAGPVVVQVTEHSEWSDARRPATPERPEHAADTGHYDGGPIARGHMYIIRTDAADADVATAVAKALPAGTLWRRVPYEDAP